MDEYTFLALYISALSLIALASVVAIEVRNHRRGK